MLETHQLFVVRMLLALMVLSAVSVAAQTQNPPAAQPKLALNATLVLTKDFCKTHTKGGWTGYTVLVGKEACKQIGPALETVFSSLTTLKAVPASGDFQVVLVPKFVEAREKGDAKAVLAGPAGHHEMLISVEWTVKDKSGNTIWSETVQGSARRRSDVTIFGHGPQKEAQAAVDDMLTQTVSKLRSVPELQKLANASPEPAKSSVQP